jgi:hypothetical protein
MKKAIAFGIIAVVVLAWPIGAYVVKFGTSVSGEHTRWAEFWSAMSGIYAPILALATLALLAMQYSLQRRVHKHEKDQAFIQQNEGGCGVLCAAACRTVGGEPFGGECSSGILADSFSAFDRVRSR